MSYDLSELLPIYFSSIIEIVNVITKIVTVIDCVAWSAMEWTIFGLVDICWPRFSLFWEMKGVVGHKNLEDVSERLRQWGVRLPLRANWAFRSVVARRRDIIVLGLRLGKLNLRLRWQSLDL